MRSTFAGSAACAAPPATSSVITAAMKRAAAAFVPVTLAPLAAAPLWRISLRDVDGLDVDEFPDAVTGELAAVPAFLDAAERQPRVGSHGVVHEHASTFDQVGGDALATCDVAGDDRASRAERR